MLEAWKGNAGFPDEPGTFGDQLVAKEFWEPACAGDGFFGFRYGGILRPSGKRDCNQTQVHRDDRKGTTFYPRRFHDVFGLQAHQRVCLIGAGRSIGRRSNIGSLLFL
jgi:hypothetical protein